MEYTDNPNEDDSTTTTPDPPAQAGEDAGTPINPFFVVNMMIYAVIGLLILIFCVWIPCSYKRNPGITLGRLEEALPFMGSLSERENAPMLQQPALEAAEGGQHPQDVQGLPQGQEEAEGLLPAQEPRDGDVTEQPGVRHVTFNASVVRDNESSNEAARASDDGVEASARDEEPDQQDGCPKNAETVYSSGHVNLPGDVSSNDATSLPRAAVPPPRAPSIPPRPPSIPPRPPSVPPRAPSPQSPSVPPSAPSGPPSPIPDFEDGEYVMLSFLRIPSPAQVDNIEGARGPLVAACQADDVESPEDRQLPSIQPTAEERRSRLLRLRRQQKDLPDLSETLDDQPLPPVTSTADQRCRHARQQKVEGPDDGPNAEQTVPSNDREASDLRDAQAEGGESLADQSPMSVGQTAEERLRRQQNTEDETLENVGQEVSADSLSSRDDDDDKQSTQTAQEHLQRLQRRQKDEDDEDYEDDAK